MAAIAPVEHAAIIAGMDQAHANMPAAIERSNAATASASPASSRSEEPAAGSSKVFAASFFFQPAWTCPSHMYSTLLARESQVDCHAPAAFRKATPPTSDVTRSRMAWLARLMLWNFDSAGCERALWQSVRNVFAAVREVPGDL
jgi:hypothetical protein